MLSKINVGCAGDLLLKRLGGALERLLERRFSLRTMDVAWACPIDAATQCRSIRSLLVGFAENRRGSWRGAACSSGALQAMPFQRLRAFLALEPLAVASLCGSGFSCSLLPVTLWMNAKLVPVRLREVHVIVLRSLLNICER
jgi:hypothetical protein